MATQQSMVPQRRRRVWPWLAGALLLLGAGGFAALRLTPLGGALAQRAAGVPWLGQVLGGKSAASGSASGTTPAEASGAAPATPGGGAGPAGSAAAAPGAAAGGGSAAAVSAGGADAPGLAAREALLRQREAEVAAQADELTRRLTQVKQLQAQLAVLAQGPRLADVVRSMPPAAAAGALQSLSDAEFVAVLRSLDAQAAADILAKVDPARAARLVQAWNAALTQMATAVLPEAPVGLDSG